MCSELETRDVLDRYIASAFGLKLSKGRLTEIDKKNYVLTLDFALKVSMHHAIIILHIVFSLKVLI